MSLLYIECNAGAAGDMLCAALFELLTEQEAAEALRLMNDLPLPNVSIACERTSTCGIAGTHVRVSIAGHEEHSHDMHDSSAQQGHHSAHDHGPHDHHGHHPHHHEHRSLGDIEEFIASFDALPAPVRENACAVYRSIAKAEADVHGSTVDRVHFHEVGTLDAVVDVTFACLLMHLIAPDRAIVSPVRTGFGEVRCAHGALPVPAPATARLLQGVPAYAGDIEGEFCTPTGAALIRHFATSFGERPTMTANRIGYGIGSKGFPIANCVRAFIDETSAPAACIEDSVMEVCCDLDDMTAEDIAFACERLREAGALDVRTVSVGMKKGRPGTTLCALCDPELTGAIEEAFFRHTTTLGVRRHLWQRTVLQREVRSVDTPLGAVRQKRARRADGSLERAKWEHDDLARLAREHDTDLTDIRRRL